MRAHTCARTRTYVRKHARTHARTHARMHAACPPRWHTAHAGVDQAGRPDARQQACKSARTHACTLGHMHSQTPSLMRSSARTYGCHTLMAASQRRFRASSWPAAWFSHAVRTQARKRTRVPAQCTHARTQPRTHGHARNACNARTQNADDAQLDAVLAACVAKVGRADRHDQRSGMHAYMCLHMHARMHVYAAECACTQHMLA